MIQMNVPHLVSDRYAVAVVGACRVAVLQLVRPLSMMDSSLLGRGAGVALRQHQKARQYEAHSTAGNDTVHA